MKTFVRILLGVQLLLIFTPFAAAKTHKDVYQMSCDALWKGVRDTIRNSGKYGIIGIDGNEMTASFNIGGNLTGKRINSVVLNRLSPTTCELQTQTAYSGLVNNDYGDFKKRVDESLAKLAKEDPGAVKSADAAMKPPELVPRKDVQFPAGLKAGLTPDEVKKAVGNPTDSVDITDSLIYLYPGYKLIFQKGQLADVRYPETPK
jgi:hypothetical protein